MDSLSKLFSAFAWMVLGLVFLVGLFSLVLGTEYFGNLWLAKHWSFILFYAIALLPFLLGTEQVVDFMLEDMPHHKHTYLVLGLLLAVVYIWVAAPTWTFFKPGHTIFGFLALWSFFKSFRVHHSLRRNS